MSHIQTYYAMRCKIIYYYVASSIGNSSVAAGIVIVFLYLVSKYLMYSLGTSEKVAVCIKQNGVMSPDKFKIVHMKKAKG
jgi:hypothetical protein